jgi:hypothetical protein
MLEHTLSLSRHHFRSNVSGDLSPVLLRLTRIAPTVMFRGSSNLPYCTFVRQTPSTRLSSSSCVMFKAALPVFSQIALHLERFVCSARNTQKRFFRSTANYTLALWRPNCDSNCVHLSVRPCSLARFCLSKHFLVLARRVARRPSTRNLQIHLPSTKTHVLMTRKCCRTNHRLANQIMFLNRFRLAYLRPLPPRHSYV